MLIWNHFPGTLLSEKNWRYGAVSKCLICVKNIHIILIYMWIDYFYRNMQKNDICLREDASEFGDLERSKTGHFKPHLIVISILETKLIENRQIH